MEINIPQKILDKLDMDESELKILLKNLLKQHIVAKKSQELQQSIKIATESEQAKANATLNALVADLE